MRAVHGEPVPHTPAYLTRLYDDELARLLEKTGDEDEKARLRQARRESEEMIVSGRHDPV